MATAVLTLPSTNTGVVAGLSTLPSLSPGVVGGLVVMGMATAALTLPLTNTVGVGGLVRGGQPKDSGILHSSSSSSSSSVKLMRPKSAPALRMRCKSSTSTSSNSSYFSGLSRFNALDMMARPNSLDDMDYYAMPFGFESGKGARMSRRANRCVPKSTFEQFVNSYPWGSESQNGNGNTGIRNEDTSTGRGHETPTLDECGSDLTMQAAEGKLRPVVGREEQILLIIEVLGRMTKNNACLIGEPGVGKTAVAEGLAQLIASGDVPLSLANKKVISLDVGLLVSGTKYRGDFEGKLKMIMEEIKQSDGQVILFIDEMHTLMGAGTAEGGINAANLMKAALARGELQCIGATTLDEYRKHIEQDPAFERRFQPIQIPEPTVGEAIHILRELRQLYENHYNVQYTDEALKAAAQLSQRYISDRFLPDKAIDLIDAAGSAVWRKLPKEAQMLDNILRQITKEKYKAIRSHDFKKAEKLCDIELEVKEKGKEIIEALDRLTTVTELDIQQCVSRRTGIPVDKVSTNEADRLLKMEETLHKRVIGQDEAVRAISRAIRRARVGLKNPNRPIASFIFCGPTGVGKSELAKTMATSYFGSEKSMVRLDMSEFMESHSVSQLIGSPPGYIGYQEGGQLTEAVRRHPYTLVLFDEIEKAHPRIFNLMLQILEDGRLTDSKGRTVDFKNTLIIMTSNVGSSDIENKYGSYKQIKGSVTERLKRHFRPEFLNRLDETIVFRQLTKLEVEEIADIMLKEFHDRLKSKEIELRVTERFKDKVVDEGYDPSYGARPLRRAITRLLEDTMAEKMLAKEIKEGDSVILDVDSDGNVIMFTNSST
ncbi:PREDICTED: ATP-dependent Clp protease ATP-binding subunit clpA homolog CD4B, chloroplastic-like [Fragaria vesca subsp. vesca]|uniref:ATP-dependent Clp protease ATP-binding subunit clpA homolog CD4B, chloroplastic-like n=1 Tax=Fragaria vesca subsp. vesca TaxID=101020 RepID=UPI0002C2F5E8|nr:PREDICTED: ATP-dependent Clp protease ATP-binding subunit clpA homolog CD4B, chloroplastic-like [Fragaria vesca subsp. vesca]